MVNKELLIEIGTEEIPAAALDFAMRDLKSLAAQSFANNGIPCENIEVYGTPRRLVLHVPAMPEAQEDKVIENRGPAKSVAFGKDGNPTKAAIGFAKGQGVEIADISIISTEKGEYIAVNKKIEGKKTKEVLSEILPQIILSVPFRKSMRWGDSAIRFIRPIHWILALFDGRTVNFSVGNIKSGNLSCGHRFLSLSKFAVRDFKHYKNEMKNRYVIIDVQERKNMIRSDMAKIEKLDEIKQIHDDELLDHVANLVEYPVTVHGNFDKKFLKLPKEVLINSMKEHQKYFAMEKKGKSKLTNSFVNVINTIPKDVNVVIKGNERVLRARLSDAEFFYNEDLKKKLIDYNELLKGVTFHNKLGTTYEKVERIINNARFIAQSVAPESENAALRSALLCKADLVTEMVGEFPKLQGIMGREYALLSGEDNEVAQAINEHYFPTGADSTLPQSAAGSVVSIADKIDTIVACFSVGLIPTGTTDPFALRRQTLGIINIILDNKFPLSIGRLINNAFDNVKEKATRGKSEIISDVTEFFAVRLKNMLTSTEFSYDVVDAVLALGLDNINQSLEKVKALTEFKNRTDFEALAISFKRVANIVKGIEPKWDVSPSLFTDGSEHGLFEMLGEVSQSASKYCLSGKYLKSLEVMTKLKAPVDKFFDDVLVMDKDLAVKNNRLALLNNIQAVFANIADFSKLK